MHDRSAVTSSSPGFQRSVGPRSLMGSCSLGGGGEAVRAIMKAS